ncbi:MAG: peptidoglycan DD-metalloendopeptidase family protein [Candidatus Marinimicrobia bacterium]|nr:peptidoglycan DD-metalloendopeptidase family protein [Candidatus Neomarinimicrobiota bacterium]
MNNGEYYIDINENTLIGNSLFEIENGYLTLLTLEENVPTWLRIYNLNGNLKFEKIYTKVINLTTSENKKFITFFNGENLMVLDNSTFQVEKFEGSVIFNIDNFGNPIFTDKKGKIHYKNKIYNLSEFPQKIIFYQNAPLIFTSKKAFLIKDDLKETLNFLGKFFEAEIIDSSIYIVEKVRENADIVFNLYIMNDIKHIEKLDKIVLRQNLNRTHESILVPLNYGALNSPFPIGNSYGEIQQYLGIPYLHPGVDFLGDDYQEVYAARDGFVKAVLTTGGDPYWRIAIANENISTETEGYLYAHLNQTSITVNVGDQVYAGDLLGTLYPWPSYDFTHIHFARLQDEGAQWFGDWWTIENPLVDVTNIQDTIPPTFENAINEDLFAYVNNGGTYLDPTNLSGEFDIIAKCHDIANSNWRIDIWDISFSLNPADDTDSIVYEKFSFSYDMPIDMYFSNDWTDIVLNTIYSRDATCYSIGNYVEREYYHIITNSNGDTTITEEDEAENFDSTDFLDGSYWLKVTARDASMNTTVDSMLVYFNNGLSGCTDPLATNYDPEATEDDGSCIYGMLGDLNQDSQLNVLDIVVTVNIIMEDIIPDEYQLWAADWNEDNSIDVVDIVGIVQCIITSCWDNSTTVTDIDGNVYNTVVIGNQEWMAENLKVTHYRNGDEISTGFDNSEWGSLPMGSYAVYDDNPANTDTYGNYYNWYAVDDDRNIAPEGWHIPTDEEIMELEMYLGMSWDEAHNTGLRGTNEGGMLKEGGTEHWSMESCGDPECPDGSTGCNCSGFSALPGGYRHAITGNYENMNYYGYFWSASDDGSINAWRHSLYLDYSAVARFDSNKHFGFSVRCIKDGD